MHQGHGDVVLSDDVGEALGTIFASEYLVGHRVESSSIVPPGGQRVSEAANRRVSRREWHGDKLGTKSGLIGRYSPAAQFSHCWRPGSGIPWVAWNSEPFSFPPFLRPLVRARRPERGQSRSQ